MNTRPGGEVSFLDLRCPWGQGLHRGEATTLPLSQGVREGAASYFHEVFLLIFQIYTHPSRTHWETPNSRFQWLWSWEFAPSNSVLTAPRRSLRMSIS